MSKYKSKEKYSMGPLTVPNLDLELSSLMNTPNYPYSGEDSNLPTDLHNDADIKKLELELLKITHECIPVARQTYLNDPKKSNSDSLNTFISQSREIAHDIRNLQDKKRQTEKVLNECLKPSIMKIYNHMLSIKEFQAESLSCSFEEFDDQAKTFLKQILQEIQIKLEDVF